MAGPLFPELGSLYNQGLVNGIQVFTQPGGPGTKVLPQAPSVYPPRNTGYPQVPFTYMALISFGCGHWCNTCEVFQEFDIYTQEQAALLCCPICGFIQVIVEPASEWHNAYYSLYPLGTGAPVFQ